MKGISFVTNSKNEKIAVQIDLKQLQRHQSDIEDFLDIIIAENRKDDEDVSWEDAKKELKKLKNNSAKHWYFVDRSFWAVFYFVGE